MRQESRGGVVSPFPFFFFSFPFSFCGEIFLVSGYSGVVITGVAVAVVTFMEGGRAEEDMDGKEKEAN